VGLPGTDEVVDEVVFEVVFEVVAARMWSDILVNTPSSMFAKASHSKTAAVSFTDTVTDASDFDLPALLAPVPVPVPEPVPVPAITGAMLPWVVMRVERLS
jgi:hypothetical protein